MGVGDQALWGGDLGNGEDAAIAGLGLDLWECWKSGERGDGTKLCGWLLAGGR